MNCRFYFQNEKFQTLSALIAIRLVSINFRYRLRRKLRNTNGKSIRVRLKCSVSPYGDHGYWLYGDFCKFVYPCHTSQRICSMDDNIIYYSKYNVNINNIMFNRERRWMRYLACSCEHMTLN